MVSSTTESSADRPIFDIGRNIYDFQINGRLGEGGYGSVWAVSRGGIDYAAKAEIVNKKNRGALRIEAAVLSRAAFSPHFCKLIHAGILRASDLKVNFVVMTLLSHPLNKLRRACPEQRFTRSTAVRIAMQSLQAIEDLHSIGFIHRDIKAGNFAISVSAPTTVTLIDFGFARRYIGVDGGRISLRKPRKYAHFVGTTRYCSINVHDRIEQSRRDDLWAWLYMVVEYFQGYLPWSEKSDSKMGEMKRSIGSRLFDDFPHEFLHVYDHIKSLKYESHPNYALLRRWLAKICERCGFRDNDPFDWEEGGRFHHLDIPAKLVAEQRKDEEKLQRSRQRRDVTEWVKNGGGGGEVEKKEGGKEEGSDSPESHTGQSMSKSDGVVRRIGRSARRFARLFL